MDSDVMMFVLFLLAFVVPIFGVLGWLVHRAQRSGTKRRGGTVSSSESFNDILNSMD